MTDEKDQPAKAPEVLPDEKFDPEGDIRSQADAKAYSEHLIAERKRRAGRVFDGVHE